MARKRRGRGEGGVEQLPSGKWRAIVCGRHPQTGKRVRTSKTFPLKAQALEWLRSQSVAGVPAPITLGDWLTTWLGMHRPRVATRTYYRDDQLCTAYLRPRLGRVRLRDLTALEIERFLAAMAADRVSDSEREKAGSVLRKSLNAAVRAGQLPASPMARVKLPRVDRGEARALDADQLRHLLAVAGRLGHAACFLMWADSGLRPGELLGLQWQDFDGRRGTIQVRRAVDMTDGRLKVPKTRKSRRTIHLAPETVAALEAHRGPQAAPESPIFPTPGGGHWWHSNFNRDVFYPTIKAAGLKLSPYTLRHTMASLLLEAGESPKVVSERLGHADIALTLRTYGHLMPGMQERAAAKMSQIFRGDVSPRSSPRPPES